MIRLARHIEILLLGNECVMVPNLGGFVAHRVCARYNDGEELFLPPYRTLGFNPSLKLNDSLLAQSYVEAYDLSYPEAVSTIEDEVRELLRIMGNSGSYELNNLGRLYYDKDGRMNFEPCESGILTPEFYAFSSFEMPMLKAEKVDEVEAVPVVADTDNDSKKHRSRIIYIGKEFGQRTLNISLKAIRNVSVAAVVLATVGLFALPIAKSHNGLGTGNIESGFFEMFFHQDNADKAKPASTFKVDVEQKAQPSQTTEKAVEPAQPADAQPEEKPQTETEEKSDEKPSASTEESKSTQSATSSHWSIVICSHVTKANAEALVGKLHKDGFDAHVSTAGATKVLYGNFKTKDEAHKRLNSLTDNPTFKDAWLLEVKE